MQAVRGIEQGGGPQAAKLIQWINFSPRVFPYGSYNRTRQRRRPRPVDETGRPALGQRSVFCKGAPPPAAKAGHRNQEQGGPRVLPYGSYGHAGRLRPRPTKKK